MVSKVVVISFSFFESLCFRSGKGLRFIDTQHKYTINLFCNHSWGRRVCRNGRFFSFLLGVPNTSLPSQYQLLFIGYLLAFA